MRLRHPSPDGGPSRRGSVTFIVLACMGVAAAIALTTLRAATLARRSLRTERDLRQVECLLTAATLWAEAGLVSGTTADAVIDLAAPDLGGAGSARLTFRRAADGNPSPVEIVVAYPLEGPVTIRRSRLVVSPFPSSVSFPSESSPP